MWDIGTGRNQQHNDLWQLFTHEFILYGVCCIGWPNECVNPYCSMPIQSILSFKISRRDVYGGGCFNYWRRTWSMFANEFIRCRLPTSHTEIKANCINGAGMNKAQELPIYRNSYCLTQEVMTYTAKFPKDYKFTLGWKAIAIVGLCFNLQEEISKLKKSKCIILKWNMLLIWCFLYIAVEKTNYNLFKKKKKHLGVFRS